jgi:hypothetical protein
MTNEATNQVSLTDQELQRRSQCSLYMPTMIDPLQGPADATLRWALRERHDGKIVKPEDIRKHFTDGWMKAWTRSEKDQAYWKGPKKAAALGRRLYEFLLKYEVIHPYQAYSLQFDNGKVTGENALVLWTRYRHAPVPLVVDAFLRRPRHTQIPNYAALAQWLAARQEVDTVDLGIAHFPLLSGDRWLSKDVREPLAQRWLGKIVDEAAAQRNVPRVGTLCQTCSQPCKEVFRGPDGPDWD